MPPEARGWNVNPRPTRPDGRSAPRIRVRRRNRNASCDIYPVLHCPFCRFRLLCAICRRTAFVRGVNPCLVYSRPSLRYKRKSRTRAGQKGKWACPRFEARRGGRSAGFLDAASGIR